MAPGGNIGVDAAIFEAVHGTAPDIVGKGIANPTALMLSAAMMLDHLKQDQAAARLRKGIRAALQDDKARTRDLGGQGTTTEYTAAVIRYME
jgi:isocitrate dehydrogenase (NAD+)